MIGLSTKLTLTIRASKISFDIGLIRQGNHVAGLHGSAYRVDQGEDGVNYDADDIRNRARDTTDEAAHQPAAPIAGLLWGGFVLHDDIAGARRIGK